MGPLTVDRLVLHAPGRSASEGEILVRAVAARLSQTALAAGRVDTLHARLTAAQHEAPDRLAARIVTDLQRQLGHKPRPRGA